MISLVRRFCPQTTPYSGAGVKQCTSPVVDGLSDDKEISDCFRSKLSGLLNSSESISRNSVDDIDDVEISIELVEHCMFEGTWSE